MMTRHALEKKNGADIVADIQYFFFLWNESHGCNRSCQPSYRLQGSTLTGFTWSPEYLNGFLNFLNEWQHMNDNIFCQWELLNDNIWMTTWMTTYEWQHSMNDNIWMTTFNEWQHFLNEWQHWGAAQRNQHRFEAKHKNYCNWMNMLRRLQSTSINAFLFTVFYQFVKFYL